MNIDLDDLFKIIVILVIVLGWIGSAFFKVFVKANRQDGGAFPRQGGAFPRQVRPPQQPGGELGRAIGPGEMDEPDRVLGPKRELDDFFNQLRRAAEEAERGRDAWEDPAKRAQEAFAGGEGKRAETMEAEPWDQYEWEVIPEPPPPARQPPKLAEVLPKPAAQKPAPAPPRRDSLQKALAEAIRSAPEELGPTEGETPSEMDLPHWLSIAELTQPGGANEVLGMPIWKAILLREVLGPPKAYRMRQPAHFRRTI